MSIRENKTHLSNLITNDKNKYFDCLGGVSRDKFQEIPLTEESHLHTQNMPNWGKLYTMPDSFKILLIMENSLNDLSLVWNACM